MRTDPAMLWMLAAFITGTIATARATRLVTHDDWPPIANVRDWWDRMQTERDYGPAGRLVPAATLTPRAWAYGWGSLLTCPFCFAPYAAAVNLTWAMLAGVYPDGFWSMAWWWVNLWAAGAYLAAILVVRDEPDEEDE